MTIPTFSDILHVKKLLISKIEIISQQPLKICDREAYIALYLPFSNQLYL